jgi:hypothetical protein
MDALPRRDPGLLMQLRPDHGSSNVFFPPFLFSRRSHYHHHGVTRLVPVAFPRVANERRVTYNCLPSDMIGTRSGGVVPALAPDGVSNFWIGAPLSSSWNRTRLNTSWPSRSLPAVAVLASARLSRKSPTIPSSPPYDSPWGRCMLSGTCAH